MDDVYFDVQWSHWLAAAVPDAHQRVRFEGSRLIFPEWRRRAFSTELLARWRGLAD